jgi:hypothetical protein
MRPLCKFGIEKDVKRGDLAIANNGDIQSGIVRGRAFRARAPCQNSPVMQGLRVSMGRVDEVRMRRAEVFGEFVQGVAPNKDTGRDVQHAVFSIKIVNGGAAAGRVTFAKDLLKVAVQKFSNSIIHSSISCILCRRSTAPAVTALTKYVAAQC